MVDDFKHEITTRIEQMLEDLKSDLKECKDDGIFIPSKYQEHLDKIGDSLESALEAAKQLDQLGPIEPSSDL